MKRCFKGLLIIAVGIFLMAGSASALPLTLDYGVNIQIIDGDGGGVTLTSLNLTNPTYGFGYYLNGGSYQTFAVGDTFAGGDIIELALENPTDVFYGIDHITQMTFAGDNNYNYYQSLTTSWDIGDVVTLNFSTSSGTPPDGMSPINPSPEPTTLLLLGSGLIGLVGYRKRKSSKS